VGGKRELEDQNGFGVRHLEAAQQRMDAAPADVTVRGIVGKSMTPRIEDCMPLSLQRAP